MAGKAETFELTLARELDAPVALVFRLWESREHLLRWWGPRDFTCTHFELDFRPGGKWRACITSSAHGDSWMGGEYREIERNKRLVFTFAWEDGRDQPGVDTLVTVTFEEKGGKTLQSFHQAPFIHREGRDSHIRGWNSLLDKQQDYLANMGESA